MLNMELTIIAWIPISTMLFALLPPIRAATLAYLCGWLLLPAGSDAVVEIAGFLDVDKVMATNLGVLLGTFIFCTAHLKRYRFHIADLFLLIFCFSGLAASLRNDLGMHDAVSRFTNLLVFYGAPYIAGRFFLKHREDLHTVARIIIVASAVYALAALLEWRISPQLHNFFYGEFQHAWEQHYRWGFWRPIVFFPHGLALGGFFAWTSLLAVWMYRSGGLGKNSNIPGWIIVFPILGLLSSMSFGPWGMFLFGLALLYGWEYLRWKWIALAPVLLSLTWMTIRYHDTTQLPWLVDMTAQLSHERSLSLKYRIQAEHLLIQHARERPWFGWGTHGRNRVINEEGIDVVATDQLWVLILGTSGLLGLTAFFCWWCWAIIMSMLLPDRMLLDPAVMAVLVAIGLQALNFMFNGFLSPILTLICGCVITLLVILKQQALRQPRSRPLRQEGYAIPTMVNER